MISEPIGSSGLISRFVIARMKVSAVIDFAIDQLWKRWLRLAAAARSSPTRQPWRKTRTAKLCCEVP